jgi:hypothetical protein
MIGIIIHILPQEIDQLEQTLIQLKRNSKYISNDDFLVEVVLNNNLTDWNKSKLDKDFFTSKLKYLETLTQSWAKTDFWVSNNNESIGCTDPRRLCSTKYDIDAFIWLDADIIFSDTLLYHMVESFNLLKENESNLIITPEITRLWDITWDVITNEELLLEEIASHKNYFDRDPYLSTGLVGETGLRKIDSFKFGGGWFTLISKELLTKIPIPNKMGPYYLDDTFIMTCCIEGKKKGFNASQYVITNEIIMENNKFRYNPYKEYLTSINRKDEFVQTAKDNFSPSVNDFINTL